MMGRSEPVVWVVGGASEPCRRSWTRRDGRAVLVAAGLAALVFAADFQTGFGSALPVLYLAPLVAVRELSWRPGVIVTAVVAAVLTLPGLVWAPVPAVIDRGVALAAIVAAAVGLLRWRADREALADALATAERLTRGKARFLSAAGHDLRHPLQAGVLFHDLLSRRLGGSPHAELVAGVGRALEMQRRLIDGILELSRLDGGRVRGCPARCPLGEVFGRLSDEFSPMAARAGLTLAVVPSGAVIVTDAEFLQRILRNLLDNALKFTVRGGVVLGCRRRGRMSSGVEYQAAIGVQK